MRTKASAASRRRWGWFSAVAVVVMLVTGGLAVVCFANFATSATKLFPLTDGVKSGPRRTPDVWCRAKRPYRPFVELANETSLDGKVFEARAHALFLGDTDLFDEERTSPVQVRPYFSLVRAVVVDASGTPLSPAKASSLRAAAARLDQYCSKAGA